MGECFEPTESRRNSLPRSFQITLLLGGLGEDAVFAMGERAFATHCYWKVTTKTPMTKLSNPNAISFLGCFGEEAVFAV